MSSADYRFKERWSDGIVILFSRYGEQMWTLVKVRKEHKCAYSNIPISKGSFAWKPVTHGYNRMERICVNAIKKLEIGK